MRTTIAILALALLPAGGALAQQYRGDSGPFTDREAAQLRSVWPEIRQAADFDDIDWQDVGLARAPGDYEARQILEDNWGRLRRAQDFGDIDWSDVTNERYSVFDDDDNVFRDDDWHDDTPFGREAAEIMSEVWPRIRAAEDFEHIDWQALGLTRAPGDREARELTARHWDEIRREQRFEDIDWDELDSTASSLDRNSARYTASPFTREEERILSQVWPRIREAARFEDIDWSQLGLVRAPGDRDARDLLSAHWNELRQEPRFDGIEWEDYRRTRVSLR